jgi:hypothetical protein
VVGLAGGDGSGSGAAGEYDGWSRGWDVSGAAEAWGGGWLEGDTQMWAGNAQWLGGSDGFAPFVPDSVVSSAPLCSGGRGLGLTPDLPVVAGASAARGPCSDRFALYSEPGLKVTSVLVKQWARHYPTKNLFVVDEDPRCEYLLSHGTLYALRIWSRGGRRRKCGNVTVYVNDGVVDVYGNEYARANLRALICDWAF